jgi:glycosyltransferase involved in cell wall biosynthesis
VTNVVRSCVAGGQFGAAAHVLASYLDSDLPVAVSEYTRQLVIAAAEEIDGRHATQFADRGRERIAVSYPAINTAAYVGLRPSEVAKRLAARDLTPGCYVLYLSRLAHAKGVDDVIAGFASSSNCGDRSLIIAGDGPQAAELRALARECPAADRIIFLDDVNDEEKPHLMAGCAAFVLPSKPRPEFVETFGIALVEKMLAGGGPVITTETGGIGEAVGNTALFVPSANRAAIAAALDHAVSMPESNRARMAERARSHALQFDRIEVFDRLLARIPAARERRLTPAGG